MNSEMQLFDLTSSVAVVTGASRGIGLALAEGLKNAGADVLGVGRKFDGLSIFEQLTGDVCSHDVILKACQFVENAKPKHLILLNNAGVTYPEEGAYSEEKWRNTLETNLTAPFLWIEQFIPLLKSAGSGSVINVTSIAAECAFPNNPAYMASKGGLKMLTKFYAKALGPYGVRVNNLGPGYISTNMTEGSFNDEMIRKKRAAHTFLGRWGEPADLVGTVVFLASHASSYVTGQDIYVDGGWTANGLIT